MARLHHVLLFELLSERVCAVIYVRDACRRGRGRFELVRYGGRGQVKCLNHQFVGVDVDH